ncbi:MAG: polysaccharide biosynthesis C-terminal domain-containing protein [Actinomycetota bacterium]
MSSAPAARPAAGGDYGNIIAGTSQNILGIVVAGLATLVANLLLARTLGKEAFGVVTVLTQAAFVASFATRAGMDMAVLRDVAIAGGADRRSTARSSVARAVVIAAAVSAVVALAVVALADTIRSLFSIPGAYGSGVVVAAALGLPGLAMTNVWLAATRGLKIMRHTLYIFWAGQPLLWIALMVAGWRVSETTWMATLAYSISWLLASVAAGSAWRRETAGWGSEVPDAGWAARLLRYAGPRAPAALFSQLLFWTDLFILTRYVDQAEIGVYSAVLRAGHMVVLFLTSMNLMFSPYVADLYAKGEIERLGRLFKTLTRWTLAATLPAFLLMAVAPSSVLSMFGEGFGSGRTALVILLAGQLVNIATGSVGFVLIMVGRTGWDLLVYLGSLIFDVVLAVVLASRYGMEGAAVANAVTFGVSNLARLVLVHRIVGIQPYDRAYLRLAGPVLVGGGAMLVAHRLAPDRWALDLLLTGSLGVLAYTLAYLALAATDEERTGLRRLLGRIPPG